MSSPTFPAVRIPVLADVQLPTVMRVRLPQPKGTPVDNLESAIEQALSSAIKLNALPSGARIAVGVGSRGLTNLPGLVAGVVAYLKGRGHNPFIVPAMGSHGGATAEGQAAVLERLGVSEATVGAPKPKAVPKPKAEPKPKGPSGNYCHLTGPSDGLVHEEQGCPPNP